MAPMPEQQARVAIDRLLAAAGWAVQDLKSADLQAARGVALREFELNPGHGTADYLLYVDGKACGVIEAKKQGATLTGVEAQSARYAQGLPPTLPAWRRPLPFVLIHGYDLIDHRIVWSTIAEKIPVLLTEVESLLTEGR